MPEKRTFPLTRCYGIFFLILTILLGCLFIWQTADIYFSAQQAKADIRQQAAQEGWSSLDIAVEVGKITTYSRDIVGAKLQKLLPYVCIWLAALVGAIVIAICCPLLPKRKRDPNIMLGEKLKVSRKKLSDTPKSGKEQDYQFAVVQYRHVRKQEKLLAIALAVIALLCLLFPVLYFANFSHFPSENINSEVAGAALYALPFLAVLLACAIAYMYLRHSLLKKENAALKAAIAAAERVEQPPVKKKCPALAIVRICLLVVGLTLLIIGTQNGSMEEVLIKATKICTECIGLG